LGRLSFATLSHGEARVGDGAQATAPIANASQSF
jgi:hypothetical protein